LQARTALVLLGTALCQAASLQHVPLRTGQSLVSISDHHQTLYNHCWLGQA